MTGPERPTVAAVNIRRATTDDIGRIAEMGLPFVERLGLRSTTIGIAYGLRKLMDVGAAVFVAEEGDVIGGVVIASLYRPWFADYELFASELAWWVSPGSRGTAGLRLLDAFEAWAAEHNAVPTLSEIVAIADLDAVLRRRGYVLTERAYVRRAS